MNKNTIETFVGLLVLLVASYFLYYAYNVTQEHNLDAAHQYNLYAKFDRIEGINVGGDVKLAGIKIGKIISLDLDKSSYQAVLKLGIDNEVVLPSDTSAEISSNGLLGEKYISITPGSDDETLKDQATIQFTQSSISLEALIGKFMFSGDKGKSENGTKN